MVTRVSSGLELGLIPRCPRYQLCGLAECLCLSALVGHQKNDNKNKISFHSQAPCLVYLLCFVLFVVLGMEARVSQC